MENIRFVGRDLHRTTYTLKDMYEYCSSKSLLGLDIETSAKFKRGTYNENIYKGGLDPYLSRICMIQIGDLETQFVIDAREFSKDELSKWLKPILENKKIKKVGHNMAFEGIHFLKLGIRINNIWDTMMAEKVLYNGLFIKYSLEALSQRYLKTKSVKSITLFDNDVEKEFSKALNYMNEDEAHDYVSNMYIDKSTRLQFVNWGDKPFTDKQIRYGGEDIVMPLRIYKVQKKGRLINGELYRPILDINFESNFTQVLSQVTLNGVPVNPIKWLEVYEKNVIVYQRRKKILDDYVIKNHPEFTGTPNLFTNEKHCLIEWSSSTQVTKLFKKYNLAVYQKSKSNGKMAWTVGASNLLDELPSNLKGSYYKGKEVEITDRNSLCLSYLLFKKAEQLITTFGKDWLKYIHPVTKKIHPRYNQYMITNRLSSNSPNIQQIPSTKDFRSCFEAPVGQYWLSADYSQQEVRVAAEVHNNQTMKNFFLIPNDYNGDKIKICQ